MQSFKIIGLLVLGKKFFFTIHGRGGHIGPVYTSFRPPPPRPDLWRLHMKFGFTTGRAVSEEKSF